MKNTSNGFTLIEMMVAVSLFAVVMLVTTGALFSVIAANRKALSQQTIINNLNFALESMARNIRVGSTYNCDYEDGSAIDAPDDCSSGATSFVFEAPNGNITDPSDQVVYILNNGRIETSEDSGDNFYALTAPEIVVEGLSFYVVGAFAGGEQPRVFIVLYGHAQVSERDRVDFSLQTSATQRIRDI